MKILVPLDDTPAAGSALATAVHLSKTLRYYVMAMFVNTGGEYSPELTHYGGIKAMVDKELQVKGQSVLDSAFITAKAMGCHIEGIISYGIADTEIINYVHENGVVKLVVIGRPASEIALQMCKNVVSSLKVPVLLVNREAEIKNMLVAVTNSESSRKAATFAAFLAEKTGAGITLINVIPDTASILMNYGYISEAPSMDRRITQLEKDFSERARVTLSSALKIINTSAQSVIRSGDAYRELLNAASQYDLLVLGASNTNKIGSISGKIISNKVINTLYVQ
ncbi:MAG: universal stress protein [Nitrospirae bacterium YQR-1]